MITRPLDLVSRLSQPPRDLDFFAWVNVAVITLFFMLLGSRFVLAPGVPIGVGDIEEGAVQLPVAGAPVEVPAQTSVVVSYRSENYILFEGGMYSLPDLKKQMIDYVKKHPGAVLLIRADRQVSVQAFFDLCDMARAAGFAGVQAAAEPQRQEIPLR